jgi:hypothetical protein
MLYINVAVTETSLREIPDEKQIQPFLYILCEILKSKEPEIEPFHSPSFCPHVSLGLPALSNHVLTCYKNAMSKVPIFN